MTTRAIKKLVKKDDLKDLELKLSRKSESEESEEENFVPRNKFDLLDEQLNFDQDEENPTSEDGEREEIKPIASSKTKKKKNKGKRETNQSKNFKFVSTNIQEDNATLEELSNLNLNTESVASPYENNSIRRLFKIESKYLNADNEMIRIFGAKIVQGERNAQNPRTGRRQMNRFKNNAIVNMKSTWPQFTKEGLSMKILKENDSLSKTVEFTFEHSKEYQQVQFRFLDAVESLDHNNIMYILQLNRYHIDSLIQLSDISRIHDDTQMAADLIERALFALQNSFHPSFKFTSNSTGQIYKIDYNRVENRGLFICLFKQILYIGSKACYRTSLELCKLLLSLDIQSDPLGVILLIDFYAIRSSQYEYFIEFYEAFNELKHLNLMPNMLLSYALAHFYIFNKSHNTDNLNKANKALIEALLRFPGVLMTLLDKCSIVPNKEVESHRFFAKTSHLRMPEGLKYLINLYVTRMYHEWKISENLVWLEKTVQSIIADEKKHENFFNQCKNKTNSLFSKVPPNLYRHLILSDLKEVAVHLPPEYASTATYTFDPIPPKNSIISYTRPARAESNHVAATSTESLFTFFQSLLPTFNAQELNRPQRINDENNAVGAEANRGFDFNQMVERLREFLVNIEENFPATRQNDFDENLNEDDDFD